MATQHRFKHLRSSVNGKTPTANQIELGEIAINFCNGNEFLSFKNSENEIVSIHTDEYVHDLVDSVEQTFTNGLNQVNERVEQIADSVTKAEGELQATEKVIVTAIASIQDSCSLDENLQCVVNPGVYVVNPLNISDAVHTLDKSLGNVEMDLRDEIITVSNETKDVNQKVVLLTNEVMQNEQTIAAALNQLNDSCGFNENGIFTPAEGVPYIGSCKTINQALNVLAHQIYTIAQTLGGDITQGSEPKEE